MMKIGSDNIIDRLQQNTIDNGRYQELGHLIEDETIQQLPTFAGVLKFN